MVMANLLIIRLLTMLSVFVIVSSLQKKVDPIDPRINVEWESVNLPCRRNNKPQKSNIHWYYQRNSTMNQTEISDNNRFKKKNDTLVIEPALKSNAGLYNCSWVNRRNKTDYKLFFLVILLIKIGDQGKFVPNKNYPSGELNVSEGGEFSFLVYHRQFDLDVSVVHESNTTFCDFINVHGHCRQFVDNQALSFKITSLLAGGGGRFFIHVNNVTAGINSYQLNIVVHKSRSEDFFAYLLHKIAIASVVVIVIGCILISLCPGSERTVTVEQDEFLIDDDRHLIPLEYEFSKEKLTMGNLIGEGTFETVFMAQAENILPLEPSTTVAVKMAKKTIGDAVLHLLVSDLTVLIEVGHHLNIVNFFGAVTTDIKKRELMIIYEFCEHGNIEGFLRDNVEGFVHCHNMVGSESKSSVKSNQKRTTTAKPRVFNINHLVHWAAQVADGMSYLASKHVLHGDLAARNILLTSKYLAKISDFGVMRNVQLRIFYQKHPTIDRFKWFALETVADQVFSTKSDVWAYGVFLWELFSLGSIPYDEVDNENVLAAMLFGGFRMERPKYSDEAMYGRMLLCWDANPKLRPTFETLSEELKTLLPANLRSAN